MPDYNELKEFISHAKKFMAPQVQEKIIQENITAKQKNYRRNHLPSNKENRRKYFKSEKGLKQQKMRSAFHGFYRIDGLRDVPKEEFRKIRSFYLNKPCGCHVDHVIPLNDGGKHCLENLQYLKADDNLRKKKRTDTNMKVQLMRNRFIRKI